MPATDRRASASARPRARRGRRPLSWACALLCVATFAIEPAAGRASPLVHSALPLPPTLHERLAEATVIALVEVERVRPDRLFVIARSVQRGAPGDRFSLKRSGTRPAEVVVGDRIVVLARGARSPFSPVEPFDAVIRIPSEDEAGTWRRALRSLSQAGSRSRSLLAVYGDWLDGSFVPLREEAKHGIERLVQDGAKLDETFVEARIAVVKNPALSTAVRSDAAYVACLSPVGATHLLAWLPGGIGGAQPALVETIFSLPTTTRGPAAVQALQRTLDHPNADVRRAALRSGAAALRDPAILDRLARIAEQDPDARVRANAARLIGADSGS